ncbi:MAG: YtxH domain-containing protein [Gemmatimonadales bacterium]
MTDIDPNTRLDPLDSYAREDRGGFVALAVIAAALGAGAAVLLAPDEGAKTRKKVRRSLRSLRGDAAGTVAQLQREIRRRKNQSRREKRIIALTGVMIGAGLAALLTPQSGPDARKRLGGTFSRIKVGAVDRIDRLRELTGEPASETSAAQPVRSVQELGRDPDTVF